jgi:hypothetical protein
MICKKIIIFDYIEIAKILLGIINLFSSDIMCDCKCLSNDKLVDVFKGVKHKHSPMLVVKCFGKC